MPTEADLNLQECTEVEIVAEIRATLARLTMLCGAAYKRFNIEVAYTIKPIDSKIKLLDEKITKTL